MDGILVGIDTAVADDPRLTARPPGPRTPVRIVLDGACRLPPTSNLARSAREAPVIVATTEAAPADRRDRLAGLGCEVLTVPGAAGSARVAVGPLLDEFGRRGMTNLLVEGGGRVLGSFLDAGEVDAVEVYLAPILEGGDHGFTPIRGRGRDLMSQALRLEAGDVDRVGGDLRIRAGVPQAWRARARSVLGLPVPGPGASEAPSDP
jgi:diaminohydroxyphosphoribosylaminopyrimidine deaminase/5-amino-6-(5-phosphoribosylamino)uracil reductase